MSLKEALEDMLDVPKVLVLDIEVSPAICATWGVHEQRISTDAVIEPSRMLCFAAKWLDEEDVMFFSERGGRDRMVEQSWLLCDEADIIIGFNHVSFDMKHLRREWLEAGLQPPSPWVDVDLLKVFRQQFKFMSNKLGFLVDQLGLESKLDSGGIKTWLAVMDGDKKAWAEFEGYNRADVTVTEGLYLYARQWIHGSLPHSGLFSGDMAACYSCGSLRLTPDGVVRSTTRAWVRLSCEDCGAWNKLLSNGETRCAK